MGGLFVFEDKLGFSAYEGTQQVVYSWFLLELHSSVNEWKGNELYSIIL